MKSTRKNLARRIGHCMPVAVAVAFAAPAIAQEFNSPYGRHDYPDTVFWGDTHLHTSNSTDAYSFGTRIGLDQAYRFAKGEALVVDNGMQAKLRRPLDFLVVADHAESMGFMRGIAANDPLLLSTEAGKRMSRQIEAAAKKKGPEQTSADLIALDAVSSEVAKILSPEASAAKPEAFAAFARSVWKEVADTADRHNEPHRFTAFIGYEWSSTGRPANPVNLHRVLIFKDGADKATRVMPFSATDSKDPEALWTYMERYEREIGGEVLAIPHNGNMSNGDMFPLQAFSGASLTRSYAERRTRWEPLYEVTQTKGESEAHPFLSPTDEFADYEIFNSWRGDPRELPEGRAWNEAERLFKEGEYARGVLQRGLRLHRQLGANPFKFGMIGSTDAHTGLAAVDDNNFWGMTPVTEPGPDRAVSGKATMLYPFTAKPASWPAAFSWPWQISSSGYAAVWAEENTRASLFAAMRRRETYATTGPRMVVRFFGGWDYAQRDAASPDLASIGYHKGVPMGGDLTNAPAGKAPRFLIRAVKDPDGANLDRVQVIKGWLDESGETHEKIYNVALSDGRREGLDGKAASVGNTVDAPNATYANTIGDPELAVVWTDPHFDAKELAFYYLRVLEIPTPRWTAYDAKFFRIQDIPPEAPMVTQERAYTSPIWYSPERAN